MFPKAGLRGIVSVTVFITSLWCLKHSLVLLPFPTCTERYTQYKEVLFGLHDEKIHNSLMKWVKDVNRHLSERDVSRPMSPGKDVQIVSHWGHDNQNHHEIPLYTY